MPCVGSGCWIRQSPELEISAATLEVLRRKTVSKRRHVLPFLGAGLALFALIAAAPLMKRRAQIPQAGAVPIQVQAEQSPTPLPRIDGEVVHQALPNVPQSVRDTIRGRVNVSVKVTVDASGSVMNAAFDSPGPNNYFAALAIEAARDWKFTPPRVEGRSISSEWILQFAFEDGATVAVAVQLRPPRV